MQYVADFDSASGLLRALAASLDGHGFDRLGQSRLRALPVRASDLGPAALRRRIYSWGGWAEAISPEDLDAVSWSQFGRWVTRRYPRGRYPAAFIGASNGAAAHLGAAMRAPWLPQTFLIPVRRHGDPDDPSAAFAFGVRHAPRLLRRQTDLQLHHMHDPNQDRLMVRHMTYFRVKGRRLPQAYRQFVTDRLTPDATVYVLDCRLTWPVTRVGERHVFQHGAVGGLEPEEYLRGSPRVARFLARESSRRTRWDPPEADSTAPEAEWGFETALLDDVVDTAARAGRRVVRVSYTDPEQLSLAVADAHRRWYDRIGAPQRRLLAETFVLTDPYRALAHRAVPLWLTFNVEGSARTLEKHLDAHDDYDEALLTLFSHGIESVGVASIDRWRSLIERARHGSLVGVDPDAYPADFATFARTSADLASHTDDAPPPPPLSVDEAEALLREAGPSHGVTLEEITP